MSELKTPETPEAPEPERYRFNFLKLSDRICYVRQKRGFTKTKLAELAGVTQPSVTAWESGKTKIINSETAARLGRALGVSPIWLATGTGATVETEFVVAKDDDDKTPSEGTVLIKESCIKFGCGPGFLPTFEEMEDGIPATYRLSTFQHLKVKPEDCVRFKVHGDSMSPFINDGDMVLVDTSDTTPKSGHVYAICLNEELKVKRLIVKANGGYIVRSDNRTDYPDDIIEPNDFNFIRILGRVIERAGFGNL